MKYCVFAKKNVIIYKNRMQGGKILKYLKTEKLKNHKPACADRYNYSENQEDNAKIFILDIQTTYIRN